MNDRRTATAVGLFFIAATGLYVGGQAIYGPVLSAPDLIDLTSSQRRQVVLGVGVELVGVLSIPMIAVFLFPVLSRHSPALALAYVALRVIESTLLLVVAGLTLTLVADPGAMAWSELRQTVDVFGFTPFLLSVGFVFPLSALLLNAVLWSTRLVPRAISGFGLVGGVLLLAGGLVELLDLMSGLSPIALEAVSSGPIAVQEMVFAVWLLAKGFSPGRRET